MAREYYCTRSWTHNDQWINEFVFPYKDDGFYLELGAGHWMNESATYVLEQRGWSGISFEPHYDHYQAFVQNRKNPCLRAAVWHYTGRVKFVMPCKSPFRGGVQIVRNSRQRERDESEGFLETRVPCVSLKDALPEESTPTTIDFICMDVEGGEEVILQTFPFDRFKVGAWHIETRSPNWTDDILAKNGYKNVDNPLNTTGRHNRYYLPEH